VSIGIFLEPGKIHIPENSLSPRPEFETFKVIAVANNDQTASAIFMTTEKALIRM